VHLTRLLPSGLIYAFCASIVGPTFCGVRGEHVRHLCLGTNFFPPGYFPLDRLFPPSETARTVPPPQYLHIMPLECCAYERILVYFNSSLLIFTARRYASALVAMYGPVSVTSRISTKMAKWIELFLAWRLPSTIGKSIVLSAKLVDGRAYRSHLRLSTRRG